MRFTSNLAHIHLGATGFDPGVGAHATWENGGGYGAAGGGTRRQLPVARGGSCQHRPPLTTSVADALNSFGVPLDDFLPRSGP
jgi:hypothetical protein